MTLPSAERKGDMHGFQAVLCSEATFVGLNSQSSEMRNEVSGNDECE